MNSIMTRAECEEIIKNALVSVLNIPSNRILPESTLVFDLNMDSLDAVEVIQNIEINVVLVSDSLEGVLFNYHRLTFAKLVDAVYAIKVQQTQLVKKRRELGLSVRQKHK